MKNNKLNLNCDLAEGYAFDGKIMPLIDMANLACGFHAGTPLLMEQSIKKAHVHGVTIGAHPSYPDLENFGRKAMVCSHDEIVALVIYQCAALDGLCKKHGTKVSYVKPHGALYNAMMKEMTIFHAICEAVSTYDAQVKLMILSTPHNKKFSDIAKTYKIELLYEVFADRAYGNDGLLVPRSHQEAMLTDTAHVVERAQLLMETGCIKTLEGETLKLEADTLCVHGDSPHALKQIEALRHAMDV